MTHDQFLERDARYPVRVTVQYYKCTSTAELDMKVINEIMQQVWCQASERGEAAGGQQGQGVSLGAGWIVHVLQVCPR